MTDPDFPDTVTTPAEPRRGSDGEPGHNVGVVSAVQLRRRRVLGGVSVVVGLALITVAIFAYLGKLGASSPDAVAARSDAATTTGQASGSGTATGSASKSASTAASSAPPAEATVDPNIKAPLTVVNASAAGGLAARGRDAFVGAGWEVAEIGNYTAELKTTTVFYPDGDVNAQAAATNLQKQFPKITKLEVSPPTFPYTGVVVVMTGDWDPGAG